MNKNERPAFLKGKGAAVGAVLCFVAVITMVGSYTYNHYKKDMEQQIKLCTKMISKMISL